MARSSFARDVALLLVFALALVFGLPKLLGTDTPLAVVTSWSMEPTLHVGDLIVVSGREQLRTGDIIVYVKPSGELIVHRLVEIRETALGTIYITKGDANPFPDEPPVGPERVKGKVVLVIPYLGVVRLLAEWAIRLGR